MLAPIDSEEAYEDALVRIEELWGSAPESEERGELEALVALVADYETERHPVDVAAL